MRVIIGRVNNFYKGIDSFTDKRLAKYVSKIKGASRGAGFGTVYTSFK